jgi:hypothetical protein
MDRVTSTRLQAVRRLLAARANTCFSCGRPVEPAPPNVRLRTLWFHPDCVGYRGQAGRS